MIRLGKGIVRFRIPILILCVLLLVPSVVGMLNVRINYDMLDYLPGDIDTVKGQNILLDDFGKGAFSMVMVEGMKPGGGRRAQGKGRTGGSRRIGAVVRHPGRRHHPDGGAAGEVL